MNIDDLIKKPKSDTCPIVLPAKQAAEALRDLADKIERHYEEAKDYVSEKLDEISETIQEKLKELGLIQDMDDTMEELQKLMTERQQVEREDDYPSIIPEQFIIKSAGVAIDRKYMVHPRYKNRPPGEVARVQVCCRSWLHGCDPMQVSMNGGYYVY